MFYEVHVTVDSTEVERWEKLCADLGIKPLLIQLSQGMYRRQLMCAAVHSGDDASANAYVTTLEGAIELAGFEIIRTKLERPLYDAQNDDAVAYVEMHIKLLLTDFEKSLLYHVVGEGLHISQSLLKPPVLRQKWYVTQRTYTMPPRVAERAFQSTFDSLAWQLPIASMEMEAVLYDSNPEIDAGWATA